jgi:hypothetical protein
MNNFIKLNNDEKNEYFNKAASIIKLPVHLIEKDFWVSWTLNKLFSIEPIKDFIIFKGGTTLSKVYKVIKRFSEDIDISIEKSFLGFSGITDPNNTKLSNKKRINLIKELSGECSKFVSTQFINLLREEFNKELSGVWDIKLDLEDKDKQTVLFYYPRSTKLTNSYVSSFVRIEMGAKSDHWPVIKSCISSYLQEAIPSVIYNSDIEIKILEAKRTFWEKATILHMFANAPKDKKIQIRQSRHYYDLYNLINSSIKEDAINELALLDAVILHKNLYYRSVWANYENAKKGSLKLIPSDTVLEFMKQDYSQMQVMFFDKPPAWEEIIAVLQEFESKFNNLNDR